MAAVIFVISVFVLVFVYDYKSAKRINHQFFWKSWLIVLLLIGSLLWALRQNHSNSVNSKSTLAATNTFFLNALLTTNRFYDGRIGELSDMVKELRFYVAGKPTKLTYAEMMGLHDETNFISLTNIVESTNYVVRTFNYYTSHPVLDLFQMERIKEKLNNVDHFPIRVGWMNKNRDFDDETLAMQISQIFQIQGFDVVCGRVSDLNQIKPEHNIVVQMRGEPDAASPRGFSGPSGPIMPALVQMYTELGLAQSWYIIPPTNDATIFIIVSLSR
jgi:hypothetical protein